MIHYLISPEGYLAGILDDPSFAPPGYTVHSQENYVNPSEAIFDGAAVVPYVNVPFVLPPPPAIVPFLGSPLYARAVAALIKTQPLTLWFLMAVIAANQGEEAGKQSAIAQLEKLC